ncbi:hypothetical protein [Senegalia massiliensis]|nr:hypothetical protein [Senegalia massiliensis]
MKQEEQPILVAEIDFGLDSTDYEKLIDTITYVVCEGGAEGSAG